MIRHILKKNKIRKKNFMVEPDEIFLDSKNIQNFNSQQFEGRIEKPISKKNIVLIGVAFFIFASIFVSRLVYLQIKKGDLYLARSMNNTFEKVVIFADRGIIYDRNKKELAWNVKNESEEVITGNGSDDSTNQDGKDQNNSSIDFGKRAYISPGFSHVLGYVSSPSQDKTGKFWQTEFIGKDGLEKQYSEMIKGENGSKMIETDVHGKVLYQNIVNPPKRGKDLVTTIDSGVQKELYSLIKNLADTKSFSGGAGVIVDVTNGEVLASTSFPEYDSQVLSEGKDKEKISGYMNDKRKVFLDKIISGLYTPGSIVKPFFALGALNEKIISPDKKILSTGSISIPNPYDKTKPTIFKDWKAHGWTDMREAIAVSSDVYFYTIGGGFEGQKGLGINNIGKYAKLFGIGDKTGVDVPDERSGNIPSPEWKAKNFKGDAWRIGDTYHTAIGQYGFQVTPIEMARATAALANYGTLITPHFILGDSSKENQKTKLDFIKQDLDIVHQGMRMTVTSGTTIALNVPYVKVAAKSGTAQLGINKNKVNAWVIGFFPYDNPKYAFTVMMEAGPAKGGAGASVVMRGLFDWMYQNTPEYLGLAKKETPDIKDVKPEETTNAPIPSLDTVTNSPADVIPTTISTDEIEVSR